NVAVRASNRESERVTNRLAAEYLVVTDQARQDRQPRGVCTRPAIGAARVRVERKDRARSCFPSAAAPVQRIQFVKNSIIAVDEQHVPIAVGSRIASGQTAFDPPLLRFGLFGNRIAGRPAGGSGVT